MAAQSKKAADEPYESKDIPMTKHDPNPAHVCMCDGCRSKRLRPSRSRRKQSKFDRGYDRYMANGGSFQSRDAIVTTGDTGRANRVDALYGGQGKPDGDGHGHMVTNDGVNVAYWREPGKPEAFIDDRRDDPVNG